MRKYSLFITKIFGKTVYVEADSYYDACDIAKENESIDPLDLEDYEFEDIKIQ